MHSSLVSKVTSNASLFAMFAVAGTLVVIGRKAYNVTTPLEWSLDTVKSLAHFTLKEKEEVLSRVMIAKTFTGAATALSYKYSPVAVRKDFPIGTQEHYVGNHLFWIGVSTFVLTALVARYPGKFSAHQMTRIGALAFAILATISSLAGVTLVDTVKKEYSGQSFIKYERNLAKRAMNWFTAKKTSRSQEFYPDQSHDSINRQLVETQEIRLHYNKYLDTKNFGWKETSEMGVIAGALSGLVAFVSYFSLKTLYAFGDAFPITKKAIPVAMVMAPTYAATKYFTKSYAKGNPELKWAPFIAAFLAGALLAPRVLSRRVSYQEALAISTSALGVALLLDKRSPRRHPPTPDEW